MKTLLKKVSAYMERSGVVYAPMSMRLNKLTEEVGELAECINKGMCPKEEIADTFIVVLTMMINKGMIEQDIHDKINVIMGRLDERP